MGDARSKNQIIQCGFMYCIIFMTCPDKRIANKITDVLLKKKLIACANIGPNIKSKYWWEGKIEQSSEILVMMKTKQKLFNAAKKEIKLLHPYDVPEILCVKINKGLKDYLDWIKSVTR